MFTPFTAGTASEGAAGARVTGAESEGRLTSAGGAAARSGGGGLGLWVRRAAKKPK